MSNSGTELQDEIEGLYDAPAQSENEQKVEDVNVDVDVPTAKEEEEKCTG